MREISDFEYQILKKALIYKIDDTKSLIEKFEKEGDFAAASDLASELSQDLKVLSSIQ